MRMLVEFSGEQEELALAEFMSVSRSLGGTASVIERDGQTAIVETDAPPEKLATRLALCWHISEYLFSFDTEGVEEAFGELDMEGRTFALRIKRLGENRSAEDARGLIDRAAGVLTKTGKVDLENPDVTVRIVMGGRLHAGRLLYELDRSQFEKRTGKDRPFSHPISLHPKYARALVNLTGLRPGERLLDPFCGTGGILIEAGLVGAEITGSDIDPRMIEGCGKNLAHILGPDFVGKLHELDIGKISELGKFDAVATDPPYGRSASTAKEDISGLYERAFEAISGILKPGGYLAIVFPERKYAGLGEKYMTLEGVYGLFVHRSLTRYVCVFKN